VHATIVVQPSVFSPNTIAIAESLATISA
jgi:hypothetical protein